MENTVYHNDYWDNMEHHEDGSPNPEGKKRRGACKSLLLGIMYGRGVASIAEQIHGTPEEAQEIVDNFYRAFPTVKQWMDSSKEKAYKVGYVEDAWGRRRRLPDIQLDPFSCEYKGKSEEELNFNPFLGTKNKVSNPTSTLVDKYYKAALQTKYKKETQKLIAQAEKDGISLHSNSNKISQAERQCINAIIQGSAASMSKKAMIKVHTDPELNRLGFQVLIGVHDELIGECPEENADAVAERLTFVMKHAAEPDIVVPFKCDPTIEKSWYISDYIDNMQEKFKKGLKSGEDRENLLNKFYNDYCEWTPDQILSVLKDITAD